MTTEDDFQARLAARPDDWQTRLVFADWLQDRGDPRAEGYRALGRLRLRTYPAGKRHWWTAQGDGPPTYNHLPPDWFEAVAGYEHRNDGRWRWPEQWDESRDNRREIEDAAALAFGKLPAARRAELLAAEKPKTKRKPRTRAKKAKPAAPKPKTKPKAAARKPKPKPRRGGKS